MVISRGATLAGAALLFVSPTASPAQDDGQYSVRNDTGRALTCGVRRAGSSAIDSFTIRAGETWSKTYSGSKPRLVLCEGALSRWQPLAAGRSYRLVRADADQIVAQPLS